MIAASEWLIQAGYTSAQHLAIRGMSNGGLLVAACLTQRPDLFGAVLCGVPVIDMLRYHRFTSGRLWTGEYGCADTSETDFRNLLAYSPLHNLKAGTTYPPTLIWTADGDDRVVPMHSLKFTAALQAADSGQNPIVLRFGTKAGHGTLNIDRLVAEESDFLAFLAATVGWTLQEA
jgi:prolyl oligopeptidase